MSTMTTTRGVLGIKLGMTQVWDDQNRMIPVTVVSVAPNVVTQIRTMDNDGYEAIQIASGAIDPRKVTSPLKGHFEKAGVTPRRHVTEIRTPDANTYLGSLQYLLPRHGISAYIGAKNTLQSRVVHLAVRVLI